MMDKRAGSGLQEPCSRVSAHLLLIFFPFLFFFFGGGGGLRWTVDRPHGVPFIIRSVCLFGCCSRKHLIKNQISPTSCLYSDNLMSSWRCNFRTVIVHSFQCAVRLYFPRTISGRLTQMQSPYYQCFVFKSEVGESSEYDSENFL